MEKKKYPFSADKHAHDIELVANRTFNLAQDALERKDYEEYDKLIAIHEEADEVLLAVQSGMVNYKVSMLDGETLGKAKKMVLIAADIREHKITRHIDKDDFSRLPDNDSHLGPGDLDDFYRPEEYGRS